MNRSATVVERKGCDLHPIDPTSEDGALTLRAFIWADQLGRLALLDSAIEIARGMPVEVQKVDAVTFLERELAGRSDGVATVVFHSIFMQYVDEAGRAGVASAPRAPRVAHPSLA